MKEPIFGYEPDCSILLVKRAKDSGKERWFALGLRLIAIRSNAVTDISSLSYFD